MRIRTRLNLPVLFAFSTLLIIGPLLFFAYSDLRKASRNELYVDNILQLISETVLLRDNYLLVTSSEHLSSQWQAKASQLEKFLHDYGKNFATKGQEDTIAGLQNNCMEIQEIFARVTANRQQIKQNEIEPEIGKELEKRLLAQFLFRNQLLYDGSLQLQTLIRERRETTRNGLVTVLLILTFGLMGTFTITAFFINRTLHSRIKLLHESAVNIARGTFSHRIPIRGQDELSDLALAVNDMSAQLQRSYSELKNEIAQRTKTEESLRASQKLLQQSEQHIAMLNRDLEVQVSKLIEANRELESFSYSVSHDLRAPLRHLAGFVELLESRNKRGLDEKSQHYLRVISDSATKMGCLIDDLLSFSRMSRSEINKKPIDLNQLVQEVIKDISRDLPAERRIEWYTGTLPRVVGDYPMLRQVLFNLLANAVKYSKNADPAKIEITALPPEAGYQVVAVRDNGSGFDMRFVDKLFGLFQRLHSAEEFEGTGVGLANVRRIISRHGGKTWAEGELNKGATFYFSLPSEVRGTS